MDGSLLAADVIIFYGPPHCGKSLYYDENLKATHQRVVPELEFQRNPELTLRQLILSKVISPLKQGNKVVIDDENASYTKRDSFLCLVRKKEPDCQVACLSFVPLHGTTQLYWGREFSLARRVGWGLTDDEGYRLHMAETDRVIDRWTHDRGSLDMPRMSEGYETIKQIKLNFKVKLKYQLELPCLLIEWDGLLPRTPADPVQPVDGAAEAISTWYEHNPSGRVVIVCDGSAFTIGTLADRDEMITSVLTSLTGLLSSCSVYLVHVQDPARSGVFSRPPRPGLVAFLQRLLHLNLTHKSSMYVYHTVPHMKMAEEAGLKYIKGLVRGRPTPVGPNPCINKGLQLAKGTDGWQAFVSTFMDKANRFFNHPALAKSSHACTTVAVPAILKALTTIPGGPEGSGPPDRPPTLPLADRALQADPCLSRLDVGCGRTVYLAAKSASVLKRYMALYASQATLVGEAPQRGPSLVRQPSSSSTPHLESTQEEETPSTHASSTKTPGRPTSTQWTKRGLPDWMKPKPGMDRKLKKTQLKSMASTTTYIMTPDEMLATAKLILAEAEEMIQDEDNEPDPEQKSPKQPQEKIKSQKRQEKIKTPRKNRNSSSDEETKPPPKKLPKTPPNPTKNSTPQKSKKYTSHTEKTRENSEAKRKKDDTEYPGTSVGRGARGGAMGKGTDSHKHYDILDDLFDDGPRGSGRIVKAPPSAGRKGKARQTHIGDFMRNEGTTPPKRKRSVAEKRDTFTSSRVQQRKFFVPETQSAELRDNSIVFAESDGNDIEEDSLLISDSMTQGPDSLVISDSDSEVTPGGRRQNQRRKSSASGLPLKGVPSVTTVPETVLASQESKNKSKVPLGEKHYSILDGLI